MGAQGEVEMEGEKMLNSESVGETREEEVENSEPVGERPGLSK